MKICYSMVFTLMPLVPILALAQTSEQQQTEQLPSQPVNYQICTLAVNTQTGESTSVCSPVYKCTSSEKPSKLSTHRELEEMDNNQSNLTTAHAIRIAM